MKLKNQKYPGWDILGIKTKSVLIRELLKNYQKDI